MKFNSIATPTLSLACSLLVGACGGGTAHTATAEDHAQAEVGVTQPMQARLTEVLANGHRSDADRARDQYRHPSETLSFFGVRSDMHVVELSVGAGWYTKILGPYLSPNGHLIAAGGNPEGEPGYMRDRAIELNGIIDANRELFGTTQVVVFAPPSTIELGPDASADAVLTFRNIHNWAQNESLSAVLAASFRALKPGGVFGVVEHRANEGTSYEDCIRTGYLPEAWVIQQVEAAGFRLDARSEVNANPRDTKDHPNGVWSLPPALRGGDADRERFVAIGESDRMTLRFIKPN